MKWKTLQGDPAEYVAKMTFTEIATIEALRAIAEQLERLADRLDVHGSIIGAATEEIRDALENWQDNATRKDPFESAAKYKAWDCPKCRVVGRAPVMQTEDVTCPECGHQWWPSQWLQI